MAKQINRLPTHPGDVIREELQTRRISQKEFSSRTGIHYTLFNEIVNCKRPVTIEIALIMEASLGLNPEMLINMQTRYNIAKELLKPDIISNLNHIRETCASWLV
ncbi:MAG TPA: addiction module antidote protein, HigA family [Porphyromonadaceae bacterium]|nr:addiction module antidote protein, HigA family [Porphyromonadaceae bacterium]